MDFHDWLDRLIDPDTRADAATKAGYAASTLSRQLGRGTLRPEMVIALCRAYGRSAATGLIETGYLTALDVETGDIPATLRKATNRQLLDEVLRRSDPEAHRLFGSGGVDGDTMDGNIIPFIPSESGAEAFDPERSVADSSPFHPEENTDFDD